MRRSNIRQDALEFASIVTHSDLAQQMIDQSGQKGVIAGLTRVGTYLLPGITRALINNNGEDALPLLIEVPMEVGFAAQTAYLAAVATCWAPEFIQATAVLGGLAVGYLHAHTFTALIEHTLYQPDSFNPDGTPITPVTPVR